MTTPADVAQLINGSRMADRLTGTVTELLDQDQTVAIAQLATEMAAQQPVPPATPYRLPGPATSPMGGMCLSSLDLMTLPFESLTRALDSTLRAAGTALTGIQVSNVSSRRSRAGSRRSEFRTSTRGSVANQIVERRSLFP